MIPTPYLGMLRKAGIQAAETARYMVSATCSVPTPEILPCVNPAMVCREVGVDGSGFIVRISSRFSGDYLVLLRDDWSSVLKIGDPTMSSSADVLDEARRQIANIFGGAR